MIFTESTLKQADTGFQSQCRPPGQYIRILRFRKIGYRKIQVLQHFLHDKFTWVPGFIQFGIIRVECFVIPGNIAISLHLLKVEISSEKTGNTIVTVTDIHFRAVMGILQIEINIAKCRKIPTVSFIGYDALSGHFEHQVGLDNQIGRLGINIDSGRNQIVIKLIRK